MKKVRETWWGIVWMRHPPAWRYALGQGALIVRETVDEDFRTIVELFSYVVLPHHANR